MAESFKVYDFIRKAMDIRGTLHIVDIIDLGNGKCQVRSEVIDKSSCIEWHEVEFSPEDDIFQECRIYLANM